MSHDEATVMNTKTQLTIRGFGPQIEQAIRNLAEREGISLNQAVLRLLRRGAGLAPDEPDQPSVIGSTLDHLAGTWSDTEAEAMAEVEKDFERIDPELWA